MMKKDPSIRNWLLRIVAGTLLALLIIPSVYGIVAYWAYYRVPAADLPCRQCSGEARAVQVNGFDLYYRELGADTSHAPVVILHGGPGNTSKTYRNSLDFLAEDYRVIYYDQRGSGYSQIKTDPSLYTVEQLVEELEVLRRDVIGADKIILIAHSAGGALAQRYALSHGEHVEKMVLVASIRINNGISIPGSWDVFSPALFVLGLGMPPADPETANAWFTQLAVEGSLSRLYDPNDRALVEGADEISFATWREVSRSLEGADFKDRLRELQTNTLIIYGVADSAYTGETAATELHELMPNSTLVRFEESGHWPFLEEPVKFQSVMLDFLLAE